MRLINAIEELSETFNSIDIRIFAFKQDDVWKNVFTLIRFRRETVEDLAKNHQKIVERCGDLVKTDEFQVGLYQFPIEKWSKIKDEFSRKFLCLRDDFAINYFDAMNFNNQINQPWYQQDKEHVFKDWKIFQGNSETSNSSRPSYHDKLIDAAISNHFSNFDDYLAAIFQIDRYDFQKNPWVNTTVPVFFKINNIEFDHDKAIVEYTGYSQKNLEVVINFYKADQMRAKSEFNKKKIKKVTMEDNENLHEKQVKFEFNTNELGNEFELLVIKNKKMLLEEKRDNISNNWKGRNEFTNPLCYLFEKFVNYDELEEMLINFQAKDLKDPSKVFERGISWLLSILKIPNVMLGKYEKIGFNSETISTDILGSFSNYQVLLVNVTTGLPKQADFDRERDYRENISKMLKNEKIKIISVYFTGKEPTEGEESANSNQVKLIGKAKLELILTLLKKGEIKEAREIFLGKEYETYDEL